jgi:hypothetical protein
MASTAPANFFQRPLAKASRSEYFPVKEALIYKKPQQKQQPCIWVAYCELQDKRNSEDV